MSERLSISPGLDDVDSAKTFFDSPLSPTGKDQRCNMSHVL